MRRREFILSGGLLAGCGNAPAPKPAPARPDPTKEAWYGQTVEQLAAIDRQAEALFQKRKLDEAGAAIQKGEPLMNRLLAVPRPTLEATEAASDLDELYGRMLLGNRHYGWARMLFQKNVARWKHWTPQTEETAQRLKKAQSEITECDRKLVE